MSRDANKGINVAYNYMNLPTQITFDAGGKIEYTYSSVGAKLRMQEYDNSGALSKSKDYLGGFVYEDNQLEFVQTAEGRAVPNGASFDYEYYLKDHLGNTRVAFNEAGEVSQETHYYPFGLRLKGGAWQQSGASRNKFLYNGKELEGEDLGLNWFDYGARFYDPQLGKWHSIDPVDFEYSPYNYALNNPVIFVDPDGSVPFIFYIRSYHPGKAFGWPMYSPGDARGPSTSTSYDVTSRITHIFKTDAAEGTVDELQLFSHPSELRPFGLPINFPGLGMPEGTVEIISKGIGGKYNTLELKQSYSGGHGSTYGTVFENMTPKIDLNSNIIIKEFANKIVISLLTNGDGFPNAEIFIEDQIGNRIMLDTYEIFPWEQPIPGLLRGNLLMMETIYEIYLDENQNFLLEPNQGNN